MEHIKKEVQVEILFYDEKANSVQTKKISYKKSQKTDMSKRKALTQYIYTYLLNQRQGTRKTKTRGEVAGSTKKIYRQKGTGRARHGDKKAPIFVGGGVAHGPKITSFFKKINKKQKKLAMRYAIEYMVDKKKLFLFSVKEIIKTKKALEIMKKFNIKKALIVTSGKFQNMRGFRNIPGVNVTHVSEINPYFILSKPNMVCDIESWEKLVQYIS